MTQYSRVALASRPKGAPTLDNFRFETADLPRSRPGEMLLRTIWLSLDPYMRGRMDDVKSYADPVDARRHHGRRRGGRGAGLEPHRISRAGDIVVGRVGWASHGVIGRQRRC